MCCTPIGREDKYLEELRFVAIAAIFFKKIYPNGQVFVGTTPEAVIPEYLLDLITFLRFPFEKNPFALSRQLFYKDFTNSDYLLDDTLVVGCDVLVCQSLGDLDKMCKMALTYRYHRTMPYCSDFVLVRKNYKEVASRFFEDVITTMRWMPPVIQDSWADQLSIAIEIGFLDQSHYDGRIHKSPRIQDVILLPGDIYLFTPNDLFSVFNDDSFGQIRHDVPNLKKLYDLSANRIGIHFKGNRKHLFIIFAYLCVKNKFIDFDGYNIEMSIEFLFREYFEYAKAKSVDAQ
jgi:hypothetical protein